MPTIDRNTGISVGLALAIIAAVALNIRESNKTQLQIASLARDVAEIRSTVADQYTLNAASENALRLANANPGLRVPDPRNVGQLIGGNP